jgi:hypothetical protein
MKHITSILFITAIFAFGFILDLSAQSRAEKREARKIERMDHKWDRKAKRRPEETSAAQATYGNGPVMTQYKTKQKGPRRKQNIHKPAKGTQSNSRPIILRKRNS